MANPNYDLDTEEGLADTVDDIPEEMLPVLLRLLADRLDAMPLSEHRRIAGTTLA